MKGNIKKYLCTNFPALMKFCTIAFFMALNCWSMQQNAGLMTGPFFATDDEEAVVNPIERERETELVRLGCYRHLRGDIQRLV